MIFSDRLKLAQEIDVFIKENNIKPNTLGVICALQIMYHCYERDLLLDFMKWIIAEEGMTTDEKPTPPEVFVDDYLKQRVFK